MTIYLDDWAMVPAPSDFELEAIDRRRADSYKLTPTSKVCLDYYCRHPNINADRPRFRQFVAAEGRAGAVLSVWQWETLWEVFQAQDERETLLDARYAGCP